MHRMVTVNFAYDNIFLFLFLDVNPYRPSYELPSRSVRGE